MGHFYNYYSFRNQTVCPNLEDICIYKCHHKAFIQHIRVLYVILCQLGWCLPLCPGVFKY